MLVLYRKPGEKIMIGDDIEIWHSVNSHGYVVLQAEAPEDVVTELVGDYLLIGDNITIRILEVFGSKVVRLGIDAPREIDIWREEIYQKIQARQGRSAA